MEQPKNWKTVTGTLLYALLSLVTYLGFDFLDADFIKLLTHFSEGLIAIGIGHKIEKAKTENKRSLDEMFNPKGINKYPSDANTSM